MPDIGRDKEILYNGNNMSDGSKKLDALQVAEYFILRSNEAKKPITNKKLQKLLYYAQAWSLVLNKEKLFPEKIEAWVHGPAVRSVYVKYKEFGFNPIQKDVDPVSMALKTRKLLDTVWNVYGKLDPAYLEQLTHSEGPWREAREGLQDCESSENEISLKTMRDFYFEKLKQAKKIKHGNS